MKRIIVLFAVCLAVGQITMAQDIEEDLFDLSLEELMNIEIVSASKKSESSFKSPLSSTVVTKDEIMASGATTIEEALRLVPGMVIREETNGNYDVHIRGNDNLPPGNYVFYSENTMSLVMIDGRPVYNYINGGTLWESLPIGLGDVERIEVVRGPSTALYGPNAVTGAINIITKTAADKSISANGNAQLGTMGTNILDLSLGSSLMDDKLKIRVSGNLENRDRGQETYYSFYHGDYKTGDQIPDYTTGLVGNNFPNPSKSKERKGANAFISYQPNDNVNLSMSSGVQESLAQSVFMETNMSPMSNRSTTSKYVDVKGDIYGFSAQISHNTSYYNILAGTGSQTSKFDSDINTANLEYDLNLGKITLRPGINYQQAVYSDLSYGGGESRGYLNAEQTLSNIGYFLRADYKPFEKLRLIAAIRNDHYNTPESDYLSYQFISTYNFTESHMVRAVYSKANRGSFVIDSYANYSYGDGITRPFIQYLGSENLELPVMTMIEVGYRGVLNKLLTLDVEIFHTETSNLTSFEPTFLGVDNFGLHLIYAYDNLDLKARQTGTTFSLNLAPSSKVQLKAYATIQQTKLQNYDKEITPVIIDPANGILELPQIERMDVVHKQTPSVFGGITGNFRPVDKFNLFAGDCTT
ncbi:MAG: TonB-dependent receptor [Cyclobacteriaceae bacterium]|nr:TonB-dependent receptor [Cyclobacteriaceae bacterium]